MSSCHDPKHRGRMDPSLALWAAMLLSFAFSREAAAAVLMRCPSPYGVSTNGQVLAVTAPDQNRHSIARLPSLQPHQPF